VKILDALAVLHPGGVVAMEEIGATVGVGALAFDQYLLGQHLLDVLL